MATTPLLTSIPHRVSLFYFVYFATVGAFVAYWAPYLVSRGLSPVQVGLTFSLIGLMRAVVPVLWGMLADRSGKRMAMIRLASLASLVFFCMIPLAQGIAQIMVLTLLYTLFWNALLPQFEVVALRQLHAHGGDYSRSRSWGSVGFILALMAVGALIDRFGIGWEPLFVALMFSAMVAAAWVVPEPSEQHPRTRDTPAFWPMLRQREVAAMLLASFCVQFSFAPYYQFFTLLLDHHGYSRSSAGMLWSLGVVAEIVMFMFAQRLLSRFPAGWMFTAVVLSAALRWLLTGWLTASLPWLLLAQLLHALSFAAHHSLAMYYVQSLFPPGLHGRAQALYSAATFGLGSSLGALATGWLWQHHGPELSFSVAALAALIGALIAWRGLVFKTSAADAQQIK